VFVYSSKRCAVVVTVVTQTVQRGCAKWHKLSSLASYYHKL